VPACIETELQFLAEEMKMGSSPRSEHRQDYPYAREPKWSASEKAIARRAFDAALQRELQAVIREAKERATKLEQPADLWELEGWLTERRNEIDRTFDYRYSVLPIVFQNLIRKGWLKEQELAGLAEDKLTYVRLYQK
jgi:hypothetical protein